MVLHWITFKPNQFANCSQLRHTNVVNGRYSGKEKQCDGRVAEDVSAKFQLSFGRLRLPKFKSK